MTLFLTWPEFMSPGRLWILLAVPLLIGLYIFGLTRKNRQGMRFTNTGVLGQVVPKQSRWRRHLSVAMALLSFIALSLAWARPQAMSKVPRERATVVMVIDTSQSMAAKDVKPNRLDAAKEAATKFLLSLPSGYNVAIVQLSGKPAVIMPPTVDRGAGERVIANLSLQDGTAVGDAITEGLRAVDMAPVGDDGKPAPATMVLLSDGQSTVGEDVASATAEAKKRKTPIHTIAYGTQNGYVDLDGKRERVAPDLVELKSIANETGGEALQAKDAGQLEGALGKLKSDVGYEEMKTEVTWRWAMYALAFAVVASLGVVSMAARWP